MRQFNIDKSFESAKRFHREQQDGLFAQLLQNASINQY